MSAKQKAAFFVALLVLVLSAWSQRYAVLYRYDLWRLDHANEDVDVEDINTHIRSFGGHIFPLLERTYRDTRQSQRLRSAAAWAMIGADPRRAEGSFLPYLVRGENDDLVAQAIYDLARAGGRNAYSMVVKYSRHSNERIRRSVLFYLSEVNMPRSVELLKDARDNDPSPDVRNEAIYRLQLLGVE